MPKFTVYKDKRGEWRWNLAADNGRKIADSGEGYKEKDDCLDGIKAVKRDAPLADVAEQP